MQNQGKGRGTTSKNLVRHTLEKSQGLIKKETARIIQNTRTYIQSILTIMVGKDTTTNLS